MVPNRIGRYEVLGQLATGGMAEILLARLEGPSDFRRAVVIKRILRQYAQTSSFVAMFLDEARIVAKIRHPNVVQVQELGEHEGDVFLVLEYVAGENLSSVLKRSTSDGEKLTPELVAHVVAEACAGLHAAHELVSDTGKMQNLVHRDVSPQNIFVAYDGHVKLLDFGVALTDERVARTEVGDVKGKFEYMSPEQVNGEPLDRRSDIFAMGIVLYELGTGRRLFKRTSHARTLSAILKEPVIPPSRLVEGFPLALETVIMRALSKKPDDRYATAAEMRKDLLEIARVLSSPVESLAERMQRLFPERIAEKNELLRMVRDGDQVAHMPEGEVEESVKVPLAEAPVSAGDPALVAMPLPAAPPLAVPVPAASPRLGLLWFGVVAGLIAIGIVGGFVALRSRQSAKAATASAAATSAEAALVPGSRPGSGTTAATAGGAGGAPGALEASIVVHVESRPAGAHVMRGGADQGVTPLDLRVPRDGAPIELELRAAGFAPLVQSVVPDSDQKLVLALQPLGRVARPRIPAAGPKGAPSSAGSGFRRFD